MAYLRQKLAACRFGQKKVRCICLESKNVFFSICSNLLSKNLLGVELMPNTLRMSYLPAIVASLALLAPVNVAAQVPGGIVYTVILPAGEFGSLAYTTVVVSGLASAQKFCSELGDPAYRVDCLAERFGVLAKAIPKGTDYSEVQAALKNASEQMANLARANRDPSLPRGRATRPGSAETTTRPLTPVSAQSAAQVNRQAAAILEETQTLLLRSAEGSKSKVAQYAQIADAIGSNKVLLRAA
jgi:hypothetical protein